MNKKCSCRKFDGAWGLSQGPRIEFPVFLGTPSGSSPDIGRESKRVVEGQRWRWRLKVDEGRNSRWFEYGFSTVPMLALDEMGLNTLQKQAYPLSIPGGRLTLSPA
jgi:hypothetical protein